MGDLLRQRLALERRPAKLLCHGPCRLPGPAPGLVPAPHDARACCLAMAAGRDAPDHPGSENDRTERAW
eukprot:10565844-Lingulodinium_polyedra.AAC.1